MSFLAKVFGGDESVKQRNSSPQEAIKMLRTTEEMLRKEIQDLEKKIYKELNIVLAYVSKNKRGLTVDRFSFMSYLNNAVQMLYFLNWCSLFQIFAFYVFALNCIYMFLPGTHLAHVLLYISLLQILLLNILCFDFCFYSHQKTWKNSFQ